MSRIAFLALVLLYSYPAIAADLWERALPFQGYARGSWTLTVTGSFTSSATYSCKLDATVTTGSSATSSAVAPSADGRVLCLVPEWTMAAQPATLSVLDSSSVPIQGPGGTAELITLVGDWTRLDAATSESAAGGLPILISGDGFDMDSDDYVCKFVCSDSSCDASRFAQSSVPLKPSNYNSLRCNLPEWEFDAAGTAGTTDVQIEKGGVALAYIGSPPNPQFQFTDIWISADVTSGLSAYGSELLTLSGYGFDVSSNAYSCVFEDPNVNPVVRRGSAASVVDARTIQCPTPWWVTAAATTDLILHKESCEGARGVAAACSGVNKVDNQIAVRYTFVQAVTNVSVSAGPASSASPLMVTVFGGGFDPAATDYEVVWRAGEGEQIRRAVNGTVTGKSLAIELPTWGFTPNQPAQVRVLQGGVAVNLSVDAALDFAFETAWTSYTDQTPIGSGDADGGETLVIAGTGFVTNVSEADGTSSDYACKFHTEAGDSILSERVRPVSATEMRCVTPPWGQHFVSTVAKLALVKGAYEFPAPLPDYHFSSFWSEWSSSVGAVGGGEPLTIGGFGFNTSVPHQCRFSYNDDQIVAFSLPVLPISTTAAVCITPTWKSWREGRTALQFLADGVPVTQKLTAANDMLAASFQFLPGFVVSRSEIRLAVGEIATFSLYPDTAPTAEVTVEVSSGDLAIAQASSPYTLSPDDGTVGNRKQVSVRHVGAGVTALSLGSDGGNFGHLYSDVVRVVCMARLILSENSAVMRTGSVVRLRVGLDVPLRGNLSVTVRSSDPSVFTAVPPLLSFSAADGTTGQRTIDLLCTGVGTATLELQVSDHGVDDLYSSVQVSTPVFGLPGFNIAPMTLDVQPDGTALLSFAPDSPPSLAADFAISNSDEAVAGTPASVSFPARRTDAKTVLVSNLAHGSASLTFRGSSPGLLQRVSLGCSQPDAIACSAAFSSSGCNFSGYTASRQHPVWLSTMAAVSAASGVVDCNLHAGCLRSACCSSTEGQACIAAVETRACNASLLVPRLSAVEDDFFDFGAAPASEADAAQLYASWAPGLSCEPYVPCAWARCFPGGGNYDGVQSAAVHVRALPGFVVHPSGVNLHLGYPVVTSVRPVTTVTGTLRVAVAVLDDNGMPTDDPIASASPAELLFTSDHAVNVTLRWLRAGRGSLALLCSEDAGDYSNVTHILRGIVSSSPGFDLDMHPAQGDDARELQSRMGVDAVFVEVGTNFSFGVRPEVQVPSDLSWTVQDQDGILDIAPRTLRWLDPSLLVPVSIRGSVSGLTDIEFSSNSGGATAAELYLLDSGFGFPSGVLTIQGYGGSGFSAEYTVGIVSWDYYYDPASMTPMRGLNYTFQGQDTFDAPSPGPNITVPRCWRTEQVVSEQINGRESVFSHAGVPVVGCEPVSHFRVENGAVAEITFEDGACAVTGLTCELELNGYGGMHFRAFFHTGVVNNTIHRHGTDYACDWACYTQPASPNQATPPQACPIGAMDCSGAMPVPPTFAFGDVSGMRAAVMVRSIPRANLTTDTPALQQGETATVFVIPYEVPTGHVDFVVEADTPLLAVTSFALAPAQSLDASIRSFEVTHLGGGSTVATVTVTGRGEGNYDGFTTSMTLRLLPGFNVSASQVTVQHYPGFAEIDFGPDTPPSKDTLVHVSVVTEFGSNVLLDSFGEKIVTMPETLLMPAGTTQSRKVRIEHGGIEGNKLRNRVAGTAIVSFSVQDPESNYDGIGLGGAAQAVEVLVKPGFESNVQGVYSAAVQKGTEFVLDLTLDHEPTEPVNLTAYSSVDTLAVVTPLVAIPQGSLGPFQVSIRHLGVVGITRISLEVSSPQGNYAGVTALDYVVAEMMPGFILSVETLHLQQQARIASFTIGLDTRPTADTEVSVHVTDDTVVGATSSLLFLLSEWESAQQSVQTVSVMWHKPGTTTITFSANSPGGNYNRVSSGVVNVIAYRPLTVSRSRLLVQKAGVSDVSVSTPLRPALATVFTMTSSPPGVVSVSPATFTVLPNTNDTRVIEIFHIARGSATVRILASAPGDIYDGVSYDVMVTAMPGFVLDNPTIRLTSCAHSPICEETFSFSPEIAPSADVDVKVSSSDDSVVSVHPTSFVFPAANGTDASFLVTVSYVSTGVACLSFAATSIGNYDRVSSGGVDVIALPEYRVNNLVLDPGNGGELRGINDFDPASPVIYVQNNSVSTFTVQPAAEPIADVVVFIEIERQSLDGVPPNMPAPARVITVSPNVTFSEGSVLPQQVAVQHLAVGNIRLTLLGSGGNYDQSSWPSGLLVKALPALVVSTSAMSVPYLFTATFTVRTSVALQGPVTLHLSSEDPTLIAFPNATYEMVNNDPITVTFIHLSPGFTRIRAEALGPASNYHHAEAVVVVTLDYPGIELATTTLHVQRWAGAALTVPGQTQTAGHADLYLTPNEKPDAQTVVNVDVNDAAMVLVQSQDYVEAAQPLADLERRLTYFPDDVADSKYFRATHQGQIGSATLTFGAPQSERWPSASGCTQSDTVCPGYSEAIYFGIVQQIPNVQTILHAGFRAPRTVVDVQRQSSVQFTMLLDQAPSQDTVVFFSSSDDATATVQESVLFDKGRQDSKNVTVFHQQPGQAFISFRSESSAFDYGGAEASRVIEVKCLQGFRMSSLLVLVQSSPTDGGQTVFQVTPDAIPDTYVVTLSLTSSDTNQILVTPTLTFQPGVLETQNATLTHVASGSIDTAVQISFELSTDSSSNYFLVQVPNVQVVPLGTFVLSDTSVVLQKGRTHVLTIAPNVAPDQDVTVFVSVSNSTVMEATPSVTLLAKKLDSTTVVITHKTAGSGTVSFRAVSLEGNYDGARLDDAVSVDAVVGFRVFSRVSGLVEDVSDQPILPTDELLVQMQPTSHLGVSTFLIATDVPVTADTSVAVVSSDDSLVTSESNVTFRAGDAGFHAVSVRHGGTAGDAIVSFRASGPAGSNYVGIESGDLHVRALPGFAFSSESVDVQKDGVGTFVLMLDTPPTAAVDVTMLSSDPSVATVEAAVRFEADQGQDGMQRTVTISYQQQGTVTISFFAAGGNYDGVIWSNGVVAASRPGFLVSPTVVDIPYDGSVEITVQPDTLPTADAVVQVLSSQPAKAAPTINSFVLRAGVIEAVSIVVRSWCSVSPGNCARAGATIISLVATSTGGNYDGVDSGAAVVATVLPPKLSLSHDAIFVQQSAGSAVFFVSPSVPPNVDTTVSFTSLDTAVCSVVPSVQLLASEGVGAGNTRTVTVTHVEVGDTQIQVSVADPIDSNYVNIDPVFVFVRTLATVFFTPSTIEFQPETSRQVTLVPSIELGADVVVSVAVSDPAAIAVSPTSFTFSPPRRLIGINVTAAAGIRVVLSEAFQVFPRIGTGTITEVLNDNLDQVSVDWDSGATGQVYSVGMGGDFMLAEFEDTSQVMEVSYLSSGVATLSATAHSSDVNYNGMSITTAVAVAALPSLRLSASELTIQFGASTQAQLSPSIPPDTDLEIAVSAVSIGTVIKVADVFPASVELYRVDGTSEGNTRTLTVSCVASGSAVLHLVGTNGNYAMVNYTTVPITCLPGIELSIQETPLLRSPAGTASITVRPLTTPTARVTVVIAASDQRLVRHTLRVYFEAFVEEQEGVIDVEHAGSFLGGESFLSLSAFGGNYEGVLLPHAVRVPVAGPTLLVPVTYVTVQPNSQASFAVQLDTPPSAVATVVATASDPAVASVDGPVELRDSTPRSFTLAHVATGRCNITLHVAAPAGSTYGNVTLPTSLVVQVEALGPGFLASPRELSIRQGSPDVITVGPDTPPDSRTELSVQVNPPNLVLVSPSAYFFEQGVSGETTQLTLTWLAPGTAFLSFVSRGGLYQYVSWADRVTVTCLPSLPQPPSSLAATLLSHRFLSVDFSPPTVDAELVTGFTLQLSLSATFATIAHSALLDGSARSVVFGPLTLGACYHYRAYALNPSGSSVALDGVSCVTIIDSPSAVRDTTIVAVSEEVLLVSWLPPADSGDGTPDGVAITQCGPDDNTLGWNTKQTYTAEAFPTDDADASIQRTVPATSPSASFEITPGLDYTIRIRSITELSPDPQPNAAQAFFKYLGEPVQYYVPFRFSISTTSVTSVVGASSSFVVSPATAPTVDAVVHVRSSHPESAAATERLLFRQGLDGPQTVVILHQQVGETLISLVPEGGNYAGLEGSDVLVVTLPSEEIVL